MQILRGLRGKAYEFGLAIKKQGCLYSTAVGCKSPAAAFNLIL